MRIKAAPEAKALAAGVAAASQAAPACHSSLRKCWAQALPLQSSPALCQPPFSSPNTSPASPTPASPLPPAPSGVGRKGN